MSDLANRSQVFSTTPTFAVRDYLVEAFFPNKGFMNYQFKVLRGLDRGDYVIMLAHGAVDIAGFEQILDKVIDESGPLLDCKVLVDFQDSIFSVFPP